MIATSETLASSMKRMGAKVSHPALPFQRRARVSPYHRLAQELGYAREKTARDNVGRPYLQVAITNRVLIEAGLTEKVGELMACVEASVMGDSVPNLHEAIYKAGCADAEEDRYEADFIHNAGPVELEAWIKKVAHEIHNQEVLLAALIRERDARKAGK